MLVVAYETHSHGAVLWSLLAQTLGIVGVSHIVSSVPYRWNFRSPMFFRALKYGYPLMINGAGLAVASQADRFLVGAMLDIRALGIYSVILLATTVPANLVLRVVGTVNLANLFNSAPVRREFKRALQLAMNLSSFSASFYAVGVILLTNLVVPLVFGPKFVVSHLALCLLGLGCFFRIVRNDPFGSLMLNSGRTKSLALTNIVTASALFYMLALFYFWPTMESFFAGRLLGEATSFVFSIFIAAKKLGKETPIVSLSTLSGFLLTCAASFITIIGWAGDKWIPTLLACAAFGVVFGLWGVSIVRSFWASRREASSASPAPKGGLEFGPDRGQTSGFLRKQELDAIQAKNSRQSGRRSRHDQFHVVFLRHLADNEEKSEEA